MSDAVIIASRFQLTMYLQFSGLAILVFDYCITVSKEIIWTWDRPWNFVRVLFLVARYTPFILVSIYIYDTLGPVPMVKCTLQAEVKLWLSVLAAIITIAAESLLIIRTWVIWGRNRAVLIGLIVVGLACIAAGFIVDVIVFRSTTYTLLPSPTSGCFQPFSSATSHVWNYPGLVVFELVILFLTVAQILQYKNHRRIFYIMRNDIVYVLCILGMSVINMVITKTPQLYGRKSCTVCWRLACCSACVKSWSSSLSLHLGPSRNLDYPAL
ncbi:hypothetical protein BJ138DRAFT_340982 [Hygrophoropsis aurantiaca]|uniref:Uncharacterized protein n=1 Tax=Hygrophoropsis aurantiaca TaxID=72124 RepID=A0ACB8A5R9_9AGAM|nr:hypothetical protein BJ138DRAFT_340982 [Hygrophoropsis aurantiaca]